MKEAFILLKETFLEWKRDDAPQWGAALSYYVALAMAPLLLIVIFLAGIAFGEQAVRGEVVGQIEGTIGHQAAQLTQTIMQDAHVERSGSLALVASIAMLVIGATGVFGQLQKALNRMWNVRAQPKSNVLRLIKIRLVGLGMVLVIGFLLLVALVLSTAVSALATYAQGSIPLGGLAARLLDFGVSIVVVTLLFSLIFKVLPDVVIGWREVWVGALFTGILFNMGKILLSMYLTHSGVGSSYGAAGSLVIVLVWFFYSSQILFFGAKFTQVWARRHGKQIVPSRYAEWIREETGE